MGHHRQIRSRRKCYQAQGSFSSQGFSAGRGTSLRCQARFNPHLARVGSDLPLAHSPGRCQDGFPKQQLGQASLYETPQCCTINAWMLFAASEGPLWFKAITSGVVSETPGHACPLGLANVRLRSMRFYQ